MIKKVEDMSPEELWQAIIARRRMRPLKRADKVLYATNEWQKLRASLNYHRKQVVTIKAQLKGLKEAKRKELRVA